jgi:hypothetical protein
MCAHLHGHQHRELVRKLDGVVGGKLVISRTYRVGCFTTNMPASMRPQVEQQPIRFVQPTPTEVGAAAAQCW